MHQQCVCSLAGFILDGSTRTYRYKYLLWRCSNLLETLTSAPNTISQSVDFIALLLNASLCCSYNSLIGQPTGIDPWHPDFQWQLVTSHQNQSTQVPLWNDAVGYPLFDEQIFLSGCSNFCLQVRTFSGVLS